MNYDKLFDKDFDYIFTTRDIEDFQNYLKSKQGWVYIAKSKDNLFLKIGRTGKNPIERAKSLSSTGVLNEYEIIFSLKVFNQFLVEKKIHKELKVFKVSKEFFNVRLSSAVEIIEKIAIQEIKSLERFMNTELLKEDLSLLEHAIYL